MTNTLPTNNLNLQSTANKCLNASATLWFLTAVFGQWFFAYYILMFYGKNAVQGDWGAWSNRMVHGIIEGDLVGNIAVFIHIFLAFVITFSGPLQIMPQIRSQFPKFHRWNGRVYIATAFIIALGAIYMTWSREAVIAGLIGQISISLDGLLILFFAFMALRTAMARKFKIHRRWALRLFFAVSVVWFYRIGRGLWMFLNHGSSPGVNATLTGPFDIFLGFAGILLPLFFLELYFWAQVRATPIVKMGVASLICVLTVLLGLGIYQAAQMFWISALYP